MADIFSRDDARNLLRGKFVFMLGDSNMRASYKDLVFLLNRNEITSKTELRKRGEEHFEGDTRICFSGLTAGRHYIEGREFLLHGCHVEYHFITKCYTDQIEQFFFKIRDKVMITPDVVIMNSCIWDIMRWGPNGVEMYKENMTKLVRLIDWCLPKQTLFIWTSTLPVSSILRGGLMVKQIDFLQNTLRFDVMEANSFCRDLIVSHNYDFLDTHYYLRMQIHKRLKDGVHFEPRPMRLVTNLILTHIALAWDEPLPGNMKSIALDRIVERLNKCTKEKKSPPINLPVIPKCLSMRNTIDNIHRSGRRNGALEWLKPKRPPFGRNVMRQIHPSFSIASDDQPTPLMQTKFIPNKFDWKNPIQQRQFWMDNVEANYSPRFPCNEDDDAVGATASAGSRRKGDTENYSHYSKSRYPNFDNASGGPVRRNATYGARQRPY